MIKTNPKIARDIIPKIHHIKYAHARNLKHREDTLTWCDSSHWELPRRRGRGRGRAGGQGGHGGSHQPLQLRAPQSTAFTALPQAFTPAPS